MLLLVVVGYYILFNSHSVHYLPISSTAGGIFDTKALFDAAYSQVAVAVAAAAVIVRCCM